MVITRATLATLILLGVMQIGFARDTTAAIVLITGADNAIGLALSREYAELGWQVIATCRDPQSAGPLKSLAKAHANLTIEAMDVLDHQQVDRLAKKYRQTPIDVLINNEELAPMMRSGGIGQLDFAAFDEYMAINVVAMLKVTESFVEHVIASDQKKIITITSADSSITSVQEPQDYFYRASKAAANIIMVTVSPDLAERGIIVGLLAPLTVDVESADMQARELIETIAATTAASTGKFRGFDGRDLAW